MTRRTRRPYDEEPRADRRLSSGPDHRPAPSAPAGEVLRLQMLAGNAAVNAMMRTVAIRRDVAGAALAGAKEKPKPSSPKVTVEGIGEFEALSVGIHGGTPRVGEPGAGGPGAGGREAPQKIPMSVTVAKAFDKLSPKLHKAVADGTTVPSVTIDYGRMKLVLKNVAIVSLQSGESANDPIQQVGFEAEEGKWEFKQQPPSGGGEGGY
jgi:hypothetical protein